MDLFQGNMETIFKVLQTQRAPTYVNPAATDVTHATGVVNPTVDVFDGVETRVETVAPTTVNHPLVPSAVNRLAVVYLWGMPPNFSI